MRNKRGLSPIIATVLLMAFAVAIGAMIMNWSSQLVKEGMEEELCKQASVAMGSDLCYTGDGVRVDVKNTGTDLATLNLVIDGAQADQEITLNLDGFAKDQVIQQTVPAAKPNNFTARLVPVVQVEEGTHTCETAVHTTDTLPAC